MTPAGKEPQPASAAGPRPGDAARAIFLAPGQGEALSLVGERVRVLADGRASAGRCLIFEETTPPGGGPPLHRHSRDDEYFYVLQGRFAFVVDGARFTAEPGAFLCAPRGSTHTFRNTGATPGRMLILCAPAGLEAPFREADAAERAGAASPERLATIFARAGVEFLGPPLGPE